MYHWVTATINRYRTYQHIIFYVFTRGIIQKISRVVNKEKPPNLLDDVTISYDTYIKKYPNAKMRSGILILYDKLSVIDQFS